MWSFRLARKRFHLRRKTNLLKSKSIRLDHRAASILEVSLPTTPGIVAATQL
jgi:hypothetical protein